MDKHFDKLMSGNQKLFALVLVVIAGLLLYWLLPPLVVILKNLWLAAILGIPLLLVIFNYQTIWFYFKMLSWKITKKMISMDKMGVLEQSLQVAYEKQRNIDAHHVQINAVRVETQSRVVNITKRAEDSKSQYLSLEKQKGHQIDTDKNVKATLELLAHKVRTDEKILENLIPRLEFITNSCEQLGELRELLGHKVRSMEYTVEAKKEEYETLKALSKASNTLKDFMNDNNQDARIFNEGLSQTEKSISEFIANIEQLDKDIKPALLSMETQKISDVEEGKKIIEAYKQSLANVSFDAVQKPSAE